jgi:hypothetical protein
MPNMKCEAQALAFNVGGHFLHKLYWENMKPASSGGGGKPGGKIADALDKEFGSFERFQKESPSWPTPWSRRGGPHWYGAPRPCAHCWYR